MPAKEKKKTPKQLLALAEARIGQLSLDLSAKERDLGDVIARLASSNSGLKDVIARQEMLIETSSNARELKLRVELSEAKAKIRELQEKVKLGREAFASQETQDAERQHLLRQLAEAVGTREIMEKAHAAEIYGFKSSMSQFTKQLEDKFKVGN